MSGDKRCPKIIENKSLIFASLCILINISGNKKSPVFQQDFTGSQQPITYRQLRSCTHISAKLKCIGHQTPAHTCDTCTRVERTRVSSTHRLEYTIMKGDNYSASCHTLQSLSQFKCSNQFLIHWEWCTQKAYNIKSETLQYTNKTVNIIYQHR